MSKGSERRRDTEAYKDGKEKRREIMESYCTTLQLWSQKLLIYNQSVKTPLIEILKRHIYCSTE